MDIFAVQPYPNPSIPIGFIRDLLTLPYLFSKFGIMFRSSKPLHKGIVTATGHLEEFAHDRYRVFVPVTIDYMEFYLRPHFLSVNCRKSRNNLFSICSLAISCSYSSVVLRVVYGDDLCALKQCPGIVLPVYPVLNLTQLQSQLICYHPPTEPCFSHCQNLWFQYLHICPFSFAHNNTP